MVTDRLSGSSGNVAIKTPCVVATIANITLSGLQTIDGTSVISGNRVLVKDQTNTVDNGIWVVDSSAWQRATDFDGARDVIRGSAVYSFGGSTQSAGTWRLTTVDPVIGSSHIVFVLDTTTSIDGNVVGAASSTSDNFAIFSGTTGKVIKDSNINSASFDAAGAAASAITTHVALSDPHIQYVEIANNLSDVTASTARSNLGLNTAATHAATDFLLVSNNLSDVTASAARTNLGLVIGANVQAWDTDLDTWATKTAPSGTVIGNTDTQTLTNKTIVASSNTISALTTSMFAANVIDTDGTFSANSDTRIPTQKAVNTLFSSVSSGSIFHAARVATTANLSATYSNGSSGVGATLTNNSTQAAISIDGVSLSSADRVLVWKQSTPAQNGFYTVTTVGSGATNWVLTRATDYDAATGTEVAAGSYAIVTEGTSYGGHVIVETGVGPFTIGTTDIVFSDAGNVVNITAGTGISKSGNTLSIDSTVATLDGSQTLTNKSIVATQLTGTIAAGRMPALTGDITSSAGAVATAIAALTTKGDILARNGSSANVRLGIGNNGQILTADSSTATGLSYKYAWVLDVKTVFGAVGDGVADDTTALQAALDYIESYGGTIDLGNGLYRITLALSKTFTYTSGQSTKRPSIRGNGAGVCQILWDGANSPSTYMLTLINNAGSVAALTTLEGFTLSPISSGKNYYVSGLYLSKWSFLSTEKIYTHRLNNGLYLDQVISSIFTKLVIANNNYGVLSVGVPTSVTTPQLFGNNANSFIACTVGGNLIGGFSSIDGTFIFDGGSIESNGQSGSAGSGYGMYMKNTSTSSSVVCNVTGVYFELNGTTGDLGTNATTADIYIDHVNVVDNMSYNFTGNHFGRSSGNYAPYGIYLKKTSTTAASLLITGNHFTNYSGYTPSANRPYVKLLDNGGGTAGLTVSGRGTNYYNQSLELPDFELRTAYYSGMGQVPGALVYPSLQQSIPNATTTALIFSTVSYNSFGIWSAGDPTKLVVPANVTKVRIQGNIRLSSTSTDNTTLFMIIQKNGSSNFNGNPRSTISAGSQIAKYEMNVSSPILLVTTGDYFTLCINQNSGGSVNTDTTFTSQWFSMEIIE